METKMENKPKQQGKEEGKKSLNNFNKDREILSTVREVKENRTIGIVLNNGEIIINGSFRMKEEVWFILIRMGLITGEKTREGIRSEKWGKTQGLMG